MFDSVLVVCAGNICRSPTGEYVLKQKLEGKNIKVSSAGLTALEGKPADAKAKQNKASAEIGKASPDERAAMIEKV